MGQYYMIVNLDKKQYLNPHKFGDGLKLLEFGSSGNGTMCGLAVLLANSNGRGGGDLRSEKEVIGSWAGDRIVIAGDYAEKGDAGEGEGEDNLFTLTDQEGSGFVDVSDQVVEALLDDRWLRSEFVEVARSRAKWGEGGAVSTHIYPGLLPEVEKTPPSQSISGPSLRPDMIITGGNS